MNADDEASSAWVSVNNKLLGRFFFKNQYRNDLSVSFIQLKGKYHMAVLSGDNDGERNYLKQLFGQ
jgi:Cu+-exporting ATPase